MAMSGAWENIQRSMRTINWLKHRHGFLGELICLATQRVHRLLHVRQLLIGHVLHRAGGFFKLAEPLVKKQLDKQHDTNMTALKSLLENGSS